MYYDVDIQVLMDELWWNVGKTKEVLMYSSVHDNIAHIAVQLQHNDRFNNSLFLYWLYKLYCNGRLEELHNGNGCSYRIGTEMVLQWHCLLCSTAIDCCSAFRHKLIDTERSVTSNTVRMGEPNIGHSSDTPSRNICKTGVLILILLLLISIFNIICTNTVNVVFISLKNR